MERKIKEKCLQVSRVFLVLDVLGLKRLKEKTNSVINFRANVIPAFPVGGFNRAVGGRCGKRKFQMN